MSAVKEGMTACRYPPHQEYGLVWEIESQFARRMAACVVGEICPLTRSRVPVTMMAEEEL